MKRTYFLVFFFPFSWFLFYLYFAHFPMGHCRMREKRVRQNSTTATKTGDVMRKHKTIINVNGSKPINDVPIAIAKQLSMFLCAFVHHYTCHSFSLMLPATVSCFFSCFHVFTYIFFFSLSLCCVLSLFACATTLNAIDVLFQCIHFQIISNRKMGTHQLM